MIELRPYQRAAIDAIYQYFQSSTGNPLVVLPTGTGKSVVLAKFMQEVIEAWPDTRIICLTHIRELISQNFAELIRIWPEAPAGINSSGLGRRDTRSQILFCGIQSVHRCAHLIQDADLVIVDEAHLIPRKSDTMYQRFLGDLKSMNPCLKVIGLTATPYRLDSGALHEGEGAMFDAIAYEANVLDMITQGYLAPVVPKRTSAQLDVAGVGSRGGDFIPGQLERAVDLDDVNRSVAAEIIEAGRDRGSWLVFCTGVSHARHMAELLSAHVPTAVISGDMPAIERDHAIAAFKRGELRCLVNVNVLTTGFNAPGVDLIAMVRPTKSVGLYCLDAETEILTSHGWKGMGEVTVGDCVPALDLASRKGVWATVTGYIERDAYDEETFVSYSAPRANFRVTDNHNLLASYKQRNGQWTEPRLTPAGVVAQHRDSVRMPTAVEIDQPGVPLTDAELYFIGMVMTDGSVSPFQVTIYQSERYPDVMERIEGCLRKCGLAYSKSRIKARTDYEERYPRWRYSISAGKPRNGRDGSGCRHLFPYLDKDCSPALFNLSRRQFIVLLQGIHDGDGYKLTAPSVDWEPKSWSLCSARKTMIERLQALATIHGFTAHLREETTGRKTPIWVLTITPKAWRSVGGSGDRPQIAVEPASGEHVWCVETTTGTIITRRRGKVTVMGNCQMVGRGTRLANGKENCVVLDFAGNTHRHGPIDRISVGPKGKGDGEAPAKVCPDCDTICYAGVRRCPTCDHEFPPPAPEIARKASTAPLLSTQVQAEWIPVVGVRYERHKKPGSPDSMRVTYQCGLNSYREWVCLQHPGYPREKACKWWSRRAPGQPIPATIDEALRRTDTLAVPTRIAVKPAGKYTEIVAVDFTPQASVSQAQG